MASLGNYQEMITLVEKNYNPCKAVARFLCLILASECIPCKNHTRKCNPCKILQGNTLLTRSCKDIDSLQNLCNECILRQGSWKILSRNPEKGIILQDLKGSCKIIARILFFLNELFLRNEGKLYAIETHRFTLIMLRIKTTFGRFSRNE